MHLDRSREERRRREEREGEGAAKQELRGRRWRRDSMKDWGSWAKKCSWGVFGIMRLFILFQIQMEEERIMEMRKGLMHLFLTLSPHT